MAAKTKGSSSEKKLKATIKRLEAKLKTADANAARWKKKAQRHQAAVAASQARVTKLERKLAKATRSATKPMATQGAQPPPSATEVIRVETPVSTDETVPTPDASWTVVQLRAEARSRGIIGVARKSKADLIAALTVPV